MISSQLLTDIATFVEPKIAKVVINGVYEITTFEQKQVTNSTVALQYIIPVSEVSNVDLIELVDAEDNVLS